MKFQTYLKKLNALAEKNPEVLDYTVFLKNFAVCTPEKPCGTKQGIIANKDFKSLTLHSQPLIDYYNDPHS